MTDHDQLISRLLSLSHHAKKLTDGILYNDHPHSLDRLYRDTIEQAGDESRAAARCIKQLRKERDEARREVCKSAGILRSVVDPNQEVNEWANYIAKVNNWDCFKSEKT
jgi:hypothetical protein